MGASTNEAQTRVALEIAENIALMNEGGELRGAVCARTVSPNVFATVERCGCCGDVKRENGTMGRVRTDVGKFAADKARWTQNAVVADR